MDHDPFGGATVPDTAADATQHQHAGSDPFVTYKRKDDVTVFDLRDINPIRLDKRSCLVLGLQRNGVWLPVGHGNDFDDLLERWKSARS